MTEPTIVGPIEYVATALSAGAVIAAKTTCQEVVQDAYKGLKEKILECLPAKEKPKGEMILSSYDGSPQTWEPPLRQALAEVEAAAAKNLVEAAGRSVLTGPLISVP